MPVKTARRPTVSAKKTGESALEKTEQTREKLLAAGIHLFSQQGYEATSTRQIEAHAKVQRNLMSYHFGSKQAFWKACLERLSERLQERLAPALAQSKDIEPGERIRFLIRRFVRASAEVPEVNRIMFDEGKCQSWRLKWLVDHFSGAFFARVAELFDDGRKRNVIPDMPLIQFYYLLVSSGAVFSMAAECELLTGQNTLDDAVVDAQADTLARLLTVTA